MSNAIFFFFLISLRLALALISIVFYDEFYTGSFKKCCNLDGVRLYCFVRVHKQATLGKHRKGNPVD